MTDSTDEINTGAVLLTLWAAERMTWDDVFVERMRRTSSS
jgi:hypothetical protein